MSKSIRVSETCYELVWKLSREQRRTLSAVVELGVLGLLRGGPLAVDLLGSSGGETVNEAVQRLVTEGDLK
jgi:hypothetical protein